MQFLFIYIYQWFLGVKFATSVTPGSHKCSIKMTLYKESYINSCYLKWHITFIHDIGTIQFRDSGNLDAILRT